MARNKSTGKTLPALSNKADQRCLLGAIYKACGTTNSTKSINLKLTIQTIANAIVIHPKHEFNGGDKITLFNDGCTNKRKVIAVVNKAIKNVKSTLSKKAG